jgi:hypothetical protein
LPERPGQSRDNGIKLIFQQVLDSAKEFLRLNRLVEKILNGEEFARSISPVGFVGIEAEGGGVVDGTEHKYGNVLATS